jgi:hypothetical protein
VAFYGCVVEEKGREVTEKHGIFEDVISSRTGPGERELKQETFQYTSSVAFEF